MRGDGTPNALRARQQSGASIENEQYELRPRRCELPVAHGEVARHSKTNKRGTSAREFWVLGIATAFTACAPVATFRPASGFIDGKTIELGLGAVTLSPRPYVDEQWAQTGQLWFSAKASRWLHLSAISAFDHSAVALGGAAKALLVHTDRFAGATEVELGYGWGALGIPLAARLVGQTWLYSTPRVGTFGIDPIFGIPVGVSAHVHEGAFLRLEYQTSWSNLKAYNQRNHYGAALAVQW